MGAQSLDRADDMEAKRPADDSNKSRGIDALDLLRASSADRASAATAGESRRDGPKDTARAILPDLQIGGEYPSERSVTLLHPKPYKPPGDDTFDVTRKPTDYDPKKPTAVFLDHFDKNDTDLELTFAPHGEISRVSAEHNGFNTYALQMKNNGTKASEYAKSINQLSDMIDKGEMPLGKGDVLNISMGNQDPTFADASKFLGFEVNAGNLAQQREKILTRMGEIMHDGTRSQDDRDKATRVVETNAAIDRLQAKGVEVVHAAGNFGQDKFSWDFMNAKWQLASTKPDGKPDSFSADHALTTDGDGVVPLFFKNEGNLFSHDLMERQQGKVSIGKDGPTFQVNTYDQFMGNGHIFDRQDFDLGKRLENAASVAKPPSERMFSKDWISGADNLPSLSFDNNPQLGFRFTQVRAENPNNVRPLQADQVAVSGVIAGTSFANIEFLKEQKARLTELKSH